MIIFRRVVTACGMLGVWSGVAYGAGVAATADKSQAVAPAGAAPASPYDSLSLGVTLTTDYLVGGETQTGGKPAIEEWSSIAVPCRS